MTTEALPTSSSLPLRPEDLIPRPRSETPRAPAARASQGEINDLVQDTGCDEIGLPTELDSTVVINPETGAKQLRTRGVIPFRGHNHAFLMTQPHEQASDPNSMLLLRLPGLGEVAAHGTTANLHDVLATHYSQDTTLTIGTEGIGKDGSKLGLFRGLTMTAEEMALTRLALAASFAQGRPARVQATSMGTMIASHMAEINLTENMLDIEEYQLLASAIISQHTHVVRDMGVLFLPHVILDSWQQIRRMPDGALQPEILREMFAGNFAGAYAGNIRNLLRVTPKHRLDALTGTNKVVVVNGNRDPLKQAHMWRHQKQQDLGNVALNFLPKVGHGLAVNHLLAGAALINTSSEFASFAQAA